MLRREAIRAVAMSGGRGVDAAGAGVGVQLWIADIIAVNRKMLEEIQLRVKRIEYR